MLNVATMTTQLCYTCTFALLSLFFFNYFIIFSNRNTQHSKILFSLNTCISSSSTSSTSSATCSPPLVDTLLSNVVAHTAQKHTTAVFWLFSSLGDKKRKCRVSGRHAPQRAMLALFFPLLMTATQLLLRTHHDCKGCMQRGFLEVVRTHARLRRLPSVLNGCCLSHGPLWTGARSGKHFWKS